MTKTCTVLAATLLMGGCASSAPDRAAVEAPAPTVASAPAPASVPTPATVPAPAKAPEPAKPATVAKAAAPAPKATPPAPAKAAAPAPTPVASAAPPTLDLTSLEQRLKSSSAIGVMTKLSLKNQVDDLVKRFRAYHDGSRPPQLAELRPSYELLLMKVLSLLQDKDAPLAKDINASREAIWGLLSDREKLSRFV